MVSLTRAPLDRSLSARAIAVEQAIPPAFLPQVMTDLVRAGLVVGQVGRTGGYRLARPAATISVLDIVGAIDRSEPETGCILRDTACLAHGACAAHAVMAAGRAALMGHLRASSLEAMADAGPRPWPGGAHLGQISTR